MVKGVNKQIIEINNTGNRYFEKVLLFVTPGRGGMSERELHKRAEEFVLGLTESPAEDSLRARCTKKKARKRALLIALALVAVSVAGVIVFNVL